MSGWYESSFNLSHDLSSVTIIIEDDQAIPAIK